MTLRLFANLVILVTCVGIYIAGLAGLGLNEAGRIAWVAGGQVGGPLVATIACFAAARASRGADRVGWTYFTVAAGLYVLGNVYYVGAAALGIEVEFPAIAEICFFVMAVCFAMGAFVYGRIRERLTRTDLYNYLLIYAALTIGTLFLLQEGIQVSVLPPFATVVAVIYPAVWFSVGAALVITLMLYRLGHRTVPYTLLAVGVTLEAVSDFIYAQSLMDGTYAAVGLTQILWVASVGFITWAAAEHIRMVRIAGAAVHRLAVRRATDRRRMQEAIPGLAVIAVFMAHTVRAEWTSPYFAAAAVVLLLLFAALTMRREHWVIDFQTRLRAITERGRMALSRSQRRLSDVLESTTDSVVAITTDWRITYMNRRARAMSGGISVKIGDNLLDAVPELRGSRAARLYEQAMATGEPVTLEEHFQTIDAWIEVHAYPSRDGLAIFFRDISDRKQIHAQLAHMAHHDPLTGLSNRALFQERLQDAVAGDKEAAVLLTDLDHFKEINDSFGHPAGDRLLRQLAAGLRRVVGPGDTIARLGGDEFAIILSPYLGEQETRAVARSVLEVLSEPYEVEGNLVRVGASIGIAVARPLDAPEQVFRNADIALYAAKAEARGSYRFFAPEMERGLQERQALRNDLKTALGRNEFELAYQPIMDLRTNRICRFEALLRWRHPVNGLVPPDVFIPIAEDTGLIAEIGAWVLRAACREAMRWPETVSVAVNLSTHQFASGDLIEQIGAALDESGIRSERLELEITESVLLRDSNSNLQILNQIRGMGMRVALDDFGTGYSSLGYLQRFPFSKIKIDRSFISGLPASGESQAIVRSISGLGKALGMRITAEGVETPAQLDSIRAGCDEAQGYLISKPVPAADIPVLLDRLGVVPPAELTRLAG